IPGEELLLANAGFDAGSQFPQRKVSTKVAESVIDRLESVNIEQDQRQGAAISGRASQLPVEKLGQITFVRDIGQLVDNDEAIDLLVVLGLEVITGEKAVDAIADAKVITVAKFTVRHRHVIDESSVRALQIDNVVTVFALLDACVAPRNR